ncbi:lysozyme inhibitor LprI family protein [Fulvimonas yonginensis]|uniref:Lysozyme inhibitor LprI family protein n=1 Tax=Fulvimonas yonginensis TaxID=1495200 RepID=A0ABU8J9M8_9GAMM
MRVMLIAAVLSLASGGAAGQDARCTDRPECWPTGSAMHEGLAAGQRLARTQKHLDAQQEALVALVEKSQIDGFTDERLIAAIKGDYVAWVAYRQAQCQLEGTLTQAGGSRQTTYAVLCEESWVSNRIRLVSGILACIQQLPEKTRPFDQQTCLEKLETVVPKS